MQKNGVCYNIFYDVLMKNRISLTKLTNSIRNTYTKEQNIETEDPFACYEGDWGGNMSAEEYADDLRKP